jgi:purine nucleosidase
MTQHRSAARKILLDCDPGVDDALAIAYAVGSPDIDLVGVTTVGGNVGLGTTTSNALRVLEFLGAGDVPVTAGSAVPLLRIPVTAEQVHGADGLRGARLPAASAGPRPGYATDFIIDTVRNAPGGITLVATGPLTNIALALRREPDLAGSVRDFVIMGGSSGRGNITPAAEFNIAVDPEAAAIVFSAGWTVTMVGLDVTLQATADAAVIGRIGGLGRLATELVLPCLLSSADGDDAATEAAHNPLHGPEIHDVCAVAHVARPDLLGCEPAHVVVETTGRWTSGMTVTEFRSAPQTRNALVATTINVRAFWDSVLDTYTALAATLP